MNNAVVLPPGLLMLRSIPPGRPPKRLFKVMIPTSNDSPRHHSLGNRRPTARVAAYPTGGAGRLPGTLRPSNPGDRK